MNNEVLPDEGDYITRSTERLEHRVLVADNVTERAALSFRDSDERFGRHSLHSRSQGSGNIDETSSDR
jgi:hypothetical protein